ncbi:MAG: hypothetical protein ABJN36_17615 [Cyclobacteriaceae bacterium]
MKETKISSNFNQPLNNERKKNWARENHCAKACLSPDLIGMSLLLRALSAKFFRSEFTGLTSLNTFCVKTESMGLHGLSGERVER